MNDSDGHVTLDDVASDRMHFAEAQKHLKVRTPLEWALGGCLFSVVFSVAIWFVRPSTPFAIYILVVIMSLLLGAVAVFLNGKERDKWYKAKAADLDSIEKRIRSGERVPRPNPLMQPTGKKQPAAD